MYSSYSVFDSVAMKARTTKLEVFIKKKCILKVYAIFHSRLCNCKSR
jgi:hypothetical protein